MMWLPGGKKNLKIHLFVLTESTNMTDRRTLHDAIGHACIALCGKIKSPWTADGPIVKTA